MEEIRLRLIFKDPHILSGLQKSQGLEHSWFLVKPQHKTISDLSSNILENFQLHHSCPHGLLLSMDGFVLPPYESTCILKDKDVVSLSKKRVVLAIEGNDVPNIAENLNIVEKQPVNTERLLLANEEFDNESGGYESEESEEEGEDPVKESAHLENSLGCNAKKRKASETLSSSKKMKHCSEVAKKVDEPTEKSQQDMTSKKSLHKQKKVPDQGNKDVDSNKGGAESSKVNDSVSGMKKNNKLQENGVENLEATPNTDGLQKGPSRSSLRQYASRRLMRDMVKMAKKIAASEPDGLANAGTRDSNLHSEYRVNGETDGRRKGRKNCKQQKNKAKIQDQEMSDQPKGLLHWKQSRDEAKGSHTNRQEQTNEKSTLCEKQDQDSSLEEEAVPVEIQPGHIRFEPLLKDQALQQDQVQVAEKEARLQKSIDFSKFPFLSGQPKEGNVIAYRLLELSATWIAGLSPYRVGKVSQYNPQSGRVLLTPVAEYPAFSDADKGSMHQDSSIYKEDGSLEISFSSLIDVRLMKSDSPDSVARLSGRTSEGPATNKENPVLSTPQKKTDAPAIENGGNLWEQFSRTLKATNGDLSEEGSWGKWSTPKSTWTQRTTQLSEESGWSRGSSWSRGASRGRARGRGSSPGRGRGQWGGSSPGRGVGQWGSGSPGRGGGRGRGGSPWRGGARGRGRARGPTMNY